MKPNEWRKDFPQIKDHLCYLDSAAMSLKPNQVIDSVTHYYQDLSVNIHRGLYDIGVETTSLYEKSREVIAQYLHMTSDEIVFTRGTTDSLNIVAFSYGLNHLSSGDEIITSELEHHSSLLPWMEVAKKTGSELKYIPLTSEGRITVDNFKKVLTPKTKIVAITYVSNVLGYISPIKEIVQLAHQVGAIVVIDAAQAIPHFEINMKDLDIDFLAFSGHKMLAPTGVGVLAGKYELLQDMPPFTYGGDMNDMVYRFDAEYKDAPYKFESGTMPVASIIGFADAIRYLQTNHLLEMESYAMDVYHYALSKLEKIDGITIYNPHSDTGIIAFNINNVPPHDAISYYATKNVCMRSGHHCARLVSQFLGITGCLRASFYLYNNMDDADLLIETTKEAVAFFKEMGF